MTRCESCGTELSDDAQFCFKCGRGVTAAPTQKGTIKTAARQDLWTWLKKDDRRQLFALDGRDPISESGFMELVSGKIKEKGVPADIVRRPVRWDRSDAKDVMYFVEPHTQAINPLSCCLQFQQVGDFSFVEQKTFLTPPDLPKAPGKKRRMTGDDSEESMRYGAGIMLAGIVAFALSSALGVLGTILGLTGLILGGMMCYTGYENKNKMQEIIEHNKRCDREQAAWDKAWSDWEDRVFVHSFQESTNGQVTRVYQAVFECIKQVNAELFKGVVPTDEHEDTTMSELEQQISRRKDSYR